MEARDSFLGNMRICTHHVRVHTHTHTLILVVLAGLQTITNPQTPTTECHRGPYSEVSSTCRDHVECLRQAGVYHVDKVQEGISGEGSALTKMWISKGSQLASQLAKPTYEVWDCVIVIRDNRSHDDHESLDMLRERLDCTLNVLKGHQRALNKRVNGRLEF